MTHRRRTVGLDSGGRGAEEARGLAGVRRDDNARAVGKRLERAFPGEKVEGIGIQQQACRRRGQQICKQTTGTRAGAEAGA